MLFALKSCSQILLFFGVWGVCTYHLHFVHDLFMCSALSVYPLSTPVHASRNQYVCTIFPLLFSKNSTFLNMMSLHSLSTKRASYHACPLQSACPMHAPCTPYVHPLQVLNTLQACKVSPPFMFFAPQMVSFSN